MEQDKTIYLDNAATSWPKPPAVCEAVLLALREKGGNPGRSGHRMATAAGKVIREARELVAALFHISDPAQVIFTLNATEALNLALHGFLQPGDHVITTSLEHNSILRPLESLRGSGVEITRLPVSVEKGLDPPALLPAVRSNTKLIAITHASNVTGTLNPLEEIGKIALDKKICLLVDSAQTAGVFPLDVRALNIGMLAFAGHKSLLGPQGVGGLYISEGLKLRPLKQGGTGSNSESLLQPDIPPDRYESGTPNTPGIAGLAAGIRLILSEGLAGIREREQSLARRLQVALLQIPGVTVYGPPPEADKAPVVSFNLCGVPAADTAAVLDGSFNIACRSGLHCAPEICRTMGVLDGGAVRFSLGYYTSPEDIDRAADAVAQIAGEFTG